MTGHHPFRRQTIVYNHTGNTATPKSPWHKRVWRALGTGLRRLTMALGVFMLVWLALGLWMSYEIFTGGGPEPKSVKLSDHTVLVLKLKDGIAEKSSPVSFLSAPDDTASLPDMITALDHAATDPRVKGLILSLSAGNYSLAHMQELRTAVQRFVKTGKPASIYADSYGEGGSGLSIYYLAAAFPEIWMQPVGVVSIPGIKAELPYAKKLLDRFGVNPVFFQREEYKNAMENLTADKMSEPSRVATESMIDDMMGQIKTGILQARPKLTGKLDRIIDMGLLTDQEALKEGVIDHVDYGDTLMARYRQKINGDAESEETDFIGVRYYLSAMTKGEKQKHLVEPKNPKQIAIVRISGMISDQDHGRNPYGFGDTGGSAGKIAAAIDEAADDKGINAIILRIDSPGGSPTASETIRRSVSLAATKHKKPVYVSMGPTAASGGYWIAANATRIYALPATLTGSIGVVGGKFDLSGVWQKLDINWESIQRGQNAGMWSMNQAFTPSEAERFNAMLDSVYAHFIARVAEGRKLPPEKVREIARGRVWTGLQAQKIGLVDKLGGMDVVLDDLAGLLKTNRDDLVLVDMPKPQTPMEQLLAFLETGVSMGRAVSAGIQNLSVLTRGNTMETLTYRPLSVE